ncbi:unnamed protein product [Ectocarpus sp. 12 AP-2014]
MPTAFPHSFAERHAQQDQQQALGARELEPDCCEGLPAGPHRLHKEAVAKMVVEYYAATTAQFKAEIAAEVGGVRVCISTSTCGLTSSRP